jgi:hypothetical protein
MVRAIIHLFFTMIVASVSSACDDGISNRENSWAISSLPGLLMDNAHQLIDLRGSPPNPAETAIWILTGVSIISALFFIYIMSMTWKPEVLHPPPFYFIVDATDNDITTRQIHLPQIRLMFEKTAQNTYILEACPSLQVILCCRISTVYQLSFSLSKYCQLSPKPNRCRAETL